MASTTTIDTTKVVPSVTIDDIPVELLGHISILAGPTEYCTLRHTLRRLWLYTTGREDHYHKHFLVTKEDIAEDGIDTINVTTLCGKRHNVFDKPAIIYSSEIQVWYSSHGLQAWYRHGKHHRDGDKPAVVYPSGLKEWHQNGKKHRDNDKPAWIGPCGSKAWFQHGERHRDNGPAIVRSHGYKAWYKHGVKYTP